MSRISLAGIHDKVCVYHCASQTRLRVAALLSSIHLRVLSIGDGTQKEQEKERLLDAKYQCSQEAPA